MSDQAPKSEPKPESLLDQPASVLLSRIPGAAGRVWRKHITTMKTAQQVGEFVSGIPEAAARAWRPGGVRDWLELCRFPNLFTAMADPLAGALVLGATWWNVPAILALMLASACFYAAGVITNDWNDYKQDLQERPSRPLPSGRIGRWRAFAVAVVLFHVGLFWCWLVNVTIAGTLLVMAILVYDILVKHVPVAPAFMGLCRALNLLLGMSLMWDSHHPADATLPVLMAVLMGTYILGVTLFARREVSPSRSRQLLPGSIATWLTVIAMGCLGIFFPEQRLYSSGYLWVGLLLVAVGYRMSQALLSPTPEKVQAAVKTAILGVVLFDAALVALTRGPALAIPVALLILPAAYFGRRLYST